MKFTIDLRDPLGWPRIFVYVFCGAMILPYCESLIIRHCNLFDATDRGLSNVILAQPAILAGGKELVEGMKHFTGHSGRGVWDRDVTMILLSLIATFLVGPACLAWGFRARARYREQPNGGPGPVRIALAVAVGGVSLCTITISPVLTFVSCSSYQSMVRDSRRNEGMDVMTVGLYRIAQKAQTSYFLPASEGGCAGSWRGANTAEPLFDVQAIQKQGMAKDAYWLEGRPEFKPKYHVQVDRPDSLTITGTMDFDSASAIDADSASLRSLMIAGVTPDHINMVYQSTNVTGGN
jgi:hypothetical protein